MRRNFVRRRRWRMLSTCCLLLSLLFPLVVYHDDHDADNADDADGADDIDRVLPSPFASLPPCYVMVAMTISQSRLLTWVGNLMHFF